MTSILKHTILSFFLLNFLFGCIEPARQSVNDVLKMLEKGQFSEAIKLGGQISKSTYLSSTDHAKIDSILEICRRIKIDYTLTADQVLKSLTAYQPQIDTIVLSRLEKEHKLDMLPLDGKKIYFKNCVSNLFLLDSVYTRLKSQKDGFNEDSFPKFKLAHTSDILSKTKISGNPVNPVKMLLNYTIRVKPNTVPPGDTIKCWMPFPRENHQRQQGVRLLKTDPTVYEISPPSDEQRSIYLEKVSIENRPTIFSSTLEFTSSALSFLLNPEMIKPYQKQSPIYKEFTSEKPPQIIFNARIKSLAENILEASHMIFNVGNLNGRAEISILTSGHGTWRLLTNDGETEEEGGDRVTRRWGDWASG